MNFRLRQATAADFQLMYDIKVDSIKPYVEAVWGKWDENFQKEFIRKETPFSEVKIIENEASLPAGFIQMRSRDNDIFVGSLFLSASFQNQGYGAAVLREVFSRGKTVRLETLKINKGAVRFYLRAGMEIESEDELKYHFVKYPA